MIDMMAAMLRRGRQAIRPGTLIPSTPSRSTYERAALHRCHGAGISVITSG